MKEYKLLEQCMLAYQYVGLPGHPSVPHHIRVVIRELAENPSWDGRFPKDWYDNLNADQRNLVISFGIITLIIRENYKHSASFEERLSIVSYPRSGSTFTRYIFEKLTNYKSMPYTGWPIVGLSDIPPGDWDESGIITKLHFIGDFCKTDSLLRGNKKEKVVLLLRNPVECFWRDSRDRLGDWLEKPPSTTQPHPLNRFGTLGPGTGGNASRFGNSEYIRNICYWLQLPEDKRLLLTYEELVEDPRSFVSKAHSIIESPVISVDEFMKDYDKHFKTARLVYSNKLGQSAKSSGKSVDIYSKQMGHEMVQKIWRRTKECSRPNHEALELLEELYEERNKN